MPTKFRVDLGAMAMKRVLHIPELSMLEPHHQIVECHIRILVVVGGLPLYKDAVGVFYSPSRLDYIFLGSPKARLTNVLDLDIIKNTFGLIPFEKV